MNTTTHHFSITFHKLLHKYCLGFIFLIAIFLYSNHTRAQDKNVLSIFQSKKIKIQGHIQFGVNAVAETNLFWNLADVPQLDFDSDTEWLEFYIKPGVSFMYATGEKSALHGKISTVGSNTLGTDAFDAKNTGRITLEEAYLGYQFKIADTTFAAIFLGAKELKLGTGMLISNGASSGFERGALKLGPRKAWQKTAIAEINSTKLKGKLFYLEPNELPSNDTENKLTGIDINYYASKNKYLGVSYIKVLNSIAPYPQAALNGIGAPVITSSAREDLNALNLYLKTNPTKNLFTALDIAYQCNDRIDMTAWGGRLQIGYTLPKIRWAPTIMYSYQVFSGDNPNTTKQERFDPLYFEGSPSAWSTGSKSSMVFINSNVQSNGISLRITPTKKDIFTLRYAHILAQQLQSPIQFGQATRIEFSNDIPTVISGVTNKNLANDLFIEYNRVMSKNIYLNAGFSISFPDKGIRSITNRTSNWTGGFINMVFDF